MRIIRWDKSFLGLYRFLKYWPASRIAAQLAGVAIVVSNKERLIRCYHRNAGQAELFGNVK